MVDSETLLNWFDYQLTTDFTWASIALLVYEYVITFDDEIRLIWPSPLNATKILYFLSRYTPFIDAALLLSAQFLSVKHPVLCANLYHTNGWVFLIGTAFTEILLSMRTWAVWGQDRRITIGLPVFFIALFVPMIYLNVLFQNAFNDFVILDACFVSYNSSAPPILWLLFILLMAYDTGLVLLMSIQAVKYYRNSQTSLRRISLLRMRNRSATIADVVFQDGLLFYFGLFAFSALQVGVSRTSRAIVMNLLPNMHRVLHSAAASRIIINIRSQANQMQRGHDHSISLRPLPPASASPLSPRSPGTPHSSSSRAISSLLGRGSSPRYENSYIPTPDISPVSPTFKV